MAEPGLGPCGPWITADDVFACCGNLSQDVDLTNAINFATNVLFRLSGKQFPGLCERTVRPCFPAGTLVTTEFGPVPIEDVVPGTLVLTHENRWRRVTDGGMTGYSPILEIRGQGARLRMTPDHKIWASEVFPYDDRSQKTKIGSPDWVEAQAMIGHAWATPRDIESLPVPDLPGGHAEIDWWMIGRWIGDGWTVIPQEGKSSRAHEVMICCGHHEEDDLRARLEATGLRWREAKMRTATRFTLTNKTLALWLRKNFGIGAKGKFIPGWVLGMPESDRLELLAGYVSADGSRRLEANRERVRCGTVSYKLAVSLRMLAVSLGYPAQVGPRKQTTTHIEGRKVSGSDWWSVDWLEGPTRSTWQNEGDGKLWARVRSIEYPSLVHVPVYNIDVEEDHSYVADGIVVKNCYGDNQGCGIGVNGGPNWNVWPVNVLWQFPQWPYRDNGRWYNTGFGGCFNNCRIPEVWLPAPVTEITEVVIDGVVLPPEAYRIVQFEKLGRIDGSHWPCSNNLKIDASPYEGDNDGSKQGTWQITYTYGRGPGPDGVFAAAIFACQIAKNQCGADDCVLPQRLKQITRQDVSMAFVDPMDFLDHGLVGLYEVDMWLGSVNPYGSKRRSSIRRADQRPQYREFT